MSDSTPHQEASRQADGRRGVFHDGLLVGVTVADPYVDPWGYDARKAAADRLGLPESDLEVLLLCHIHPDTPAVDCLICVPMDKPDDTEPVCGETYDHKLKLIAEYDGHTTEICTECDAEIVTEPDDEEDPR